MSIRKVIKKRSMAPIIRSGDVSKTPRISDEKGFTLIEMMIVISLIGILATISIPNFQKAVIRAKETTLLRTLFVMRDVIDQYYSDHGKYPDSLNVLADDKYIRSVPKDPFTSSETTWILIPPDGDGVEGAIFDIHSGSDLISLEGSPYNEW